MTLDQRLARAAHHVADTVTVPEVDLAAVRSTARANQRRKVALAAVAAVAVVVVGVGVAGAALSGGQRADGPAHDPSPSPSGAWTPERIRAEGSPGDSVAAAESGLTARQYVVCDGPSCDGADGPPEDMHVALEVSQDGQSALFDVRGATQAQVRVFDEASVLVQDAEDVDLDHPVRYRLLQADGTAVELQMLVDPAPPFAGPGVIVIGDYRSWDLMDGVDDVYLVDDRAGTLRPLDVPDEAVRYWGPNVDEFLWGVSDDCRVFWATAGTLEHRRLDCTNSLDFTWMHDDMFPAGWLRPGRMAVMEQSDPGKRMFIHVSLDRGVTWQRIPVDNDHAVSDALRQLG